LREVIKDAQERVPSRPAIDIERIAAEKRREWGEKGVPAGVIEAALKWAESEARGWVKRFPPEKRQERLSEIYPGFLRDAEERYIKSVLRALREPERKRLGS